MSSVTSQSPETLAVESTIVTAADPKDLSPLEGVIMDLCNALIEARAEDCVSVESIERELFATVRRYEQSGAEKHPNADWAIPNQRALALSAAGLYDDAIGTELLALDHADSPRRFEISLGNIAERCIKANRFDEAVAWFLKAEEVAPGRTPILLTGAQALFLAGFEVEADAIFETMLASPDLWLPGTELDAYLRYESRLLSMADRLPSLCKLLDVWRSTVASGRAVNYGPCSEEDSP